jgi:hypothetical protein
VLPAAPSTMAKKDSKPKKAAKNGTKAVKKPAAAKKAAPKKPAKKTAAKVVKKATAKKTAKKTATKPQAKVAPAPVSHEDIVAEAQRLYQVRLESNQPGDELADWLAAEAALKAA